MSANDVVTLTIFVGLVLVFAWITRHWHRLRHTQFRFDLFAVRDELYLMVASDKLRSSDHMFIALRAYINSTILWSEEIGAFELAILLDESKKKNRVTTFNDLVSPYPVETRQQLESIMEKLASTTLKILNYNSSILKACRYVAAIHKVFSLSKAYQKIPETFRKLPPVRAYETVKKDLFVPKAA